MKQAKHSVRHLAGAALLSAMMTAPAAAGDDWRKEIDMKRADMSEFSMVMINDGAEAGGMTYGWAREGTTWVISDRTEMQPNILETARGVIEADTLLPLSNDIDFAIGEARNVFDLEWQGNALTGKVVIDQPGQDPRTVDVSNPEHARPPIRLSIFGLVAGLPLKAGYSVSLPWYNTLSNTIETIRLVHAGIETVSTPAGTFEAHKVDLKDGTPENVIYVTTALPQRIVRIDVVGQPMHFERLP